jgi:hypothetical protein
MKGSSSRQSDGQSLETLDEIVSEESLTELKALDRGKAFTQFRVAHH